MVGFFPSDVLAAGVCPLKVVVINDHQLDVDANITVVERSGRKHERENDVGGVEFCDLGILPVRVEVGNPASCSYTVVDNVWLEFGSQAILRVLRNIDHFLKTLPPDMPPICKVLLRVRNWEGDSPVRDFQIATDPKLVVESDDFGGVFARLRRDVPVKFTISKKGFATERLEASCLGKPERREFEVRLKASE